jgi:YD repeat-containing protein
MKISYDPEVDALSITFRETTVTTKHLAEGIAADYDASGRLAGIEVLDAIRRFGDRETLQQVIVEGISPAPTVVREKPDKEDGK